MKIHEQRNALVEAIELALHNLPSGPTLGAFGIAREDCALVHLDYFGTVDSAKMVLADALANVRGVSYSEIDEDHCCPHPRCDCKSCIGEEAAAQARAKYRAGYTFVKEWTVTD